MWPGHTVSVILGAAAAQCVLFLHIMSFVTASRPPTAPGLGLRDALSPGWVFLSALLSLVSCQACDRNFTNTRYFLSQGDWTSVMCVKAGI